MSRKILIRMIILCAVAIMAIVITSVMVSANRKLIRESNAMVNHTQQVLLNSEQIISTLKDIEVGTRGYLLTSDTAFLRPYNLSKGIIVNRIDHLKLLTADNVLQQQTVDSLLSFALARTSISKNLVEQYEKEKIVSDSAIKLIQNGRVVMDSIRAVVSRIQQNENDLLFKRKLMTASEEKNSDLLFYILFASLFVFFALVFFSIWYNFYLKKNGRWLYVAAKPNIFNVKAEAVLNGISDPFFSLDNNGLFTFINQAAKTKLGFNRPDSIGKSIFDEFPGYQNSRTGTEIKHALQTKQPQSFEAFDEFLDQWQDVTIYPVEDGITLIIRDATERKEIEKEFFKVKQFFEETSQVANVGGWEMDVKKGIIYWTPITRKIHETAADYTPELSEGISFYKEGESRDLITETVTYAMQNGTGWDLELQIVTAKGNEKWVRTIGKTDIEDGQCVRLYGTFQDITAPKKAEQDILMLASIVEYSGDAMILTDTDGTILSWNNGAEKNFGYSADEIIGKPFYTLIPESNRGEEAHIQESITKGDITKHFEKICVTKLGQLINISTSISPITNRQGNVIAMSRVMRDISEKVEAQKKIAEERHLLKTLIDSIPLNIYIKDLEFKKILVNQNEMKYIGAVNEADVLGKDDFELFPYESAKISIEEDKSVVLSGIAITDYETLITKKDGSSTWFLITKIPLRNHLNEIYGILGISYDITERKQMELANKTISQRLAIATSAAGIGIWEYDIVTNGLQWDDNMYRLYGISADNFKGAYEVWEESLHPDDKAKGNEAIQLAIEGKKEFNIEFRILTANKKVKYIQARATVTKDADGKPLQMVGTNWDITEKVIAAENLRVSEENFRGAFEYAAIGIALVGLNGEWLKVNRNLCSIVGYTNAELMNLTFQDITHPDDLHTDLELVEELVAGKIDSYQLEKRYYDKNGNIVWVMLAVSMVSDKENKPLYFVSQITNITPEKEARQQVQEVLAQLQSVLDASTQVSIIGTSADGIINVFNKGAENLLGYTAEEMIGKQNPVVIHVSTEIEKRGEELSALFNKEIKGYEVFTHYAKEGKYDSREWTYLRKDGTGFPVQLVIMPVKSGEIIKGFLGIAIDISRIKEVEGMMENKNKELALANDQLEQFAFIASHDLQEPLRTITGFIGLLEKKYLKNLDDKGKEYFEFISEGAKRMKNIINDILDYSRTGNMMSQPEQVNLNELVKFIADEIKANRNNNLTPVIEWNNLPTMLADKTAMHQLFSNLISNGVKYQAPGNSPVIKISAAENGKYWLFKIQDNGIGIKPEYYEKVFEIFRRLHGTKEYTGTGIGLAISKKIVTYHKGEIWIESPEAAGCTFCFTIPKN